jgi:hypothetical protein
LMVWGCNAHSRSPLDPCPMDALMSTENRAFTANPRCLCCLLLLSLPRLGVSPLLYCTAFTRTFAVHSLVYRPASCRYTQTLLRPLLPPRFTPRRHSTVFVPGRQIFQPRLRPLACPRVTVRPHQERPHRQSTMTELHFSSHVVQQLHAASDPFRSQIQCREARQASSSIPATPDEGVNAGPCSDSAVPNDVSSFLDASLPQPYPLPSALPQPLQTPTIEDRPHLDLTLNLPSSNVSLPKPTILRTTHSLRLPSFEVLGIAAPHPDRVPQRPDQSFSPLGAGPLSKPEDPLHALSPPIDFFKHADGDTITRVASPKAVRASVGHLVPIHTPPSEPWTISWGPFVNVRTAGLGSPPSSEPGRSPSLTTTASTTTAGQAPIIVPTHDEFSDALRMAAWIEEAKTTISKHIVISHTCLY